MDRDIRDAIELLDEIEEVLKIEAAPINWPIGMGKFFKGVYNLYTDTIHCYEQGHGQVLPPDRRISGLSPTRRVTCWEMNTMTFAMRLNLFVVPVTPLTRRFFRGKADPVFFGTALGNFGVREMLDDFVEWAPEPQLRTTQSRDVVPTEAEFSGFVFKIQANMDPKHRDRIAFVRVCSGRYEKGMKMRHVRIDKDIRIADAVSFKAGERELVESP